MGGAFSGTGSMFQRAPSTIVTSQDKPSVFQSTHWAWACHTEQFSFLLPTHVPWAEMTRAQLYLCLAMSVPRQHDHAAASLRWAGWDSAPWAEDSPGKIFSLRVYPPP